ncbi:phosphatase PAP2 family protein [Nocardioides sp.]|uniref:phosphatase PAP2 family protein n=1 Tax=Nocardioides sp. TaxID=35761 RepID=UPI002632DBBB|nr:phosphatase PAP2 family protein [Nocardioides sp.]MDI6908523.1 phosphatase PAP2 family protein [Nocardioides sp.]
MTTSDEGRPGWRVVPTLLVAWAAVLGVVLGLGWLITGPLQSAVDPWDNGVVRWFAGERSADLNRVADAGTLLGETVVGVAVAAVAAVALSLWARSLRPAVFVALVLAGVGGCYGIATVLISRDRPPVRILDPGLVPDDSFPSGHLGTAVAVYGGIALLLRWLAPRSRPWPWLLLLVPVVVALARLYQGAHHPTDELASVFYAGTWLAVVGSVVLGERGAGRAPPGPTDR